MVWRTGSGGNLCTRGTKEKVDAICTPLAGLSRKDREGLHELIPANYAEWGWGMKSAGGNLGGWISWGGGRRSAVLRKGGGRGPRGIAAAEQRLLRRNEKRHAKKHATKHRGKK